MLPTFVPFARLPRRSLPNMLVVSTDAFARLLVLRLLCAFLPGSMWVVYFSLVAVEGTHVDGSDVRGTFRRWFARTLRVVVLAIHLHDWPCTPVHTVRERTLVVRRVRHHWVVARIPAVHVCVVFPLFHDAIHQTFVLLCLDRRVAIGNEIGIVRARLPWR